MNLLLHLVLIFFSICVESIKCHRRDSVGGNVTEFHYIEPVDIPGGFFRQTGKQFFRQTANIFFVTR